MAGSTQDLDNSLAALAIDPWPLNKQSYVLVKQLGTGATSTVYEAYCEVKKSQIALKVINLDSNNVSMEELQREIQGMKKIKHENVVQYLGSFCETNMLYIMMDLCDHSLLDMIQIYKKRNQSTAKQYAQLCGENLAASIAGGSSANALSGSGVSINVGSSSATLPVSQGLFDEHTIATILREVLKGLAAIHESGLIHRDIKCGNILLRKDGSVLIADFGVSGFINTHPLSGCKDSVPLVRYTFVGTPCWMAPEVMEQRREGYTNKADIWSMGITTLEMVSGSAPYAKYPPMKVIMMTLQNEPPNINSVEERPGQYCAYGRKIRRFIADCMQRRDAQRPSAQQLLHHAFIKRKAKGASLIQHLLSGDMPPVRVRRSLDKSTSSTAVNINSPSGGGGSFIATPVVANNSTSLSGDFVSGSDGAELSSDDVAGTSNSGNASSDDDSDEGPDWDFPTYTRADETVLVQHRAPESEQTLRLRTLAVGADPDALSPDSQYDCRLRFQLRTRLWKHFQNEPFDGQLPDLQDIGFDFLIATDQANGITLELVEQELLSMHDFLCVSKEIQALVDNPFLKTRKFALSSPLPQGAFSDPAQFLGYASLTITRVSLVSNISGEAGEQQIIDLGPIESMADQQRQNLLAAAAAATKKRHSNGNSVAALALSTSDSTSTLVNFDAHT